MPLPGIALGIFSVMTVVINIVNIPSIRTLWQCLDMDMHVT